MSTQARRRIRSALTLALMVGSGLPTAANPASAPIEPGALIQELCLDTVSAGDKALFKLKGRERPDETIREEKFGKASVHHLALSETARVELTISHDDNAVMSCAVHAQVADVKATFADLQRRYSIRGKLADYLLGQPAKDVPFVSKAGKKMLGLFELQQTEGQAGGTVQAIILRDEAARGPAAALKTSPITTGSVKSVPARPSTPKPAATKAAAAPAP